MGISRSACDYGKDGFSVIPLKPRRKDALIPWKQYQQEKATQGQIETWWKQSPRANVGIVTGEVSGIIVIDCDSKEACKTIRKRLSTRQKNPSVETGKGRHFYFKWAPGIRNKAGSTPLGLGIDVRSDGGYVVAPPSIHTNRDVTSGSIRNRFSPLPKKLKEVLTYPVQTQKSQTKVLSNQHDVIKEGERNSRLTSMAGAMQRQGIGADAILATLLKENTGRCVPPLLNLKSNELLKALPISCTGQVGRTDRRWQRSPIRSTASRGSSLLPQMENMADLGWNTLATRLKRT